MLASSIWAAMASHRCIFVFYGRNRIFFFSWQLLQQQADQYFCVCRGGWEHLKIIFFFFLDIFISPQFSLDYKQARGTYPPPLTVGFTLRCRAVQCDRGTAEGGPAGTNSVLKLKMKEHKENFKHFCSKIYWQGVVKLFHSYIMEFFRTFILSEVCFADKNWHVICTTCRLWFECV